MPHGSRKNLLSWGGKEGGERRGQENEKSELTSGPTKSWNAENAFPIISEALHKCESLSFGFKFNIKSDFAEWYLFHWKARVNNLSRNKLRAQW